MNTSTLMFIIVSSCVYCIISGFLIYNIYSDVIRLSLKGYHFCLNNLDRLVESSTSLLVVCHVSALGLYFFCRQPNYMEPSFSLTNFIASLCVILAIFYFVVVLTSLIFNFLAFCSTSLISYVTNTPIRKIDITKFLEVMFSVAFIGTLVGVIAILYNICLQHPAILNAFLR